MLRTQAAKRLLSRRGDQRPSVAVLLVERSPVAAFVCREDRSVHAALHCSSRWHPLALNQTSTGTAALSDRGDQLTARRGRTSVPLSAPMISSLRRSAFPPHSNGVVVASVRNCASYETDKFVRNPQIPFFSSRETGASGIRNPVRQVPRTGYPLGQTEEQ